MEMREHTTSSLGLPYRGGSDSRSVNLHLAQEGGRGRVWGARPFSLVSLLQMLDFNAYSFYIATASLQAFESKIKKAIESRGPHDTLTEQEIKDARHLFDTLAEECARIESNRAVERLNGYRLRQIHPRLYSEVTLTEISRELVELYEAVDRDLSEKIFMYLPASDAKYYEQEALFGEDVAARFPEANKEIKEAGNCYATGNYTASVFHLMRAVEYGARALVRALRIKRGKGKDELPYTVELCDWGTIYGRLDEAVKKFPARKSISGSDRRAFYSHAVAQFGNFKDAWRNKVSHTRVRYNEHLTMDVMVNVRQFMQHLATKLKE
jgi:hypothetical protein